MGLEVHMSKVGIGDCILIRMGSSDRKLNILVDSGKNDDGYEKTLDYIENNHENIDFGIITHDDDDHILGFFNDYVDKEKDEIKTRASYATFAEGKVLMNYWKKGTRELFDYKKTARISEALQSVDVNLLLTDFIVADPDTKNEKEIPQGFNFIRISWKTDDNGDFFTKKENIDFGKEPENGWEHAELLILSPTKKSLKRYISQKLKDYKKYVEEQEKKGNIVTFAGNTGTNTSDNEWEYSIQKLYDSPLDIKEDSSKANNSSISFLLFYDGLIGLFAGDAKPSDMINTVERYLKACGNQNRKLPVDFMKMPHHASSHNNTLEFLTMFPTTNYLISTKGATYYKHPGKQTLANIAKVHPENTEAILYCNYPVWKDGPIEFRCKETSWDVNDDVCRIRINQNAGFNLKFVELKERLIMLTSDILIGL